ncbi:MAG: hypothetical protein KJ872_09400 [Alphaproteobacteria bacterium]|nr:hypothetical protein [Alphaproteobacteria bacterium]
MLRKLALAALFFIVIFIGFWVTIAPLAIAYKLVFWNDQFSDNVNIALWVIGLIGGVVAAFAVTRVVSRQWRG